MEDIAYKYVLQNAVRFEKASLGSVIGMVLAKQPEMKDKVKDLQNLLPSLIEKVNAMSPEERVKELEKLAPELLEKEVKEERKGLRPLKDVEKGKLVMRLAPSASGPLHIGHAYVFGLSAEYCRMYDGKLILRIEDTNPDNIYEPAYELLERDVSWLSKNLSETIVQSDRLKQYYDHAFKLLEMGHAYVCTCDADTFRELAAQKKPCPCRDLSVEENLARWDRMFLDFKEGEAVMRIKTDIAHPNPALRDWAAFRINDTKHVRQGTEHRVWPLMNFAVAVDDHLTGVTHSIRGKDHRDNDKKQKFIFDYFGWKQPHALFVGRINFQGFNLSTTETKKKIEYGEYEDWDDIRLPFLSSFRRRGFKPEAFINLAVQMGVHEADKTLTSEDFYQIINTQNKDLVDKEADRYFIVIDPVEIEIEKAPAVSVSLDKHPDFPKRGQRKFKTSGAFYIQKDDVEALEEGKVNRLIDCLNFKRESGKYVFVSKDYETFKNSNERGRIIHFLPHEENFVKVEVVMPDKKVFKGIGESSLSKLKVGDFIQAERFAFMRLDEVKEGVLRFWFAHK